MTATAPAGTRIEADWLQAPAVRAVFAALEGRAFFVGGCVRNALLGAPVGDVDLATPLLPPDVRRRLLRAGLQAVPTGIEHGTVTAVAHGAPYEITTFRADVETDGRHAVVRFSEDMAEDAARRDFTMNALYADADGRVLDPLAGMADLLARRVRFVGEPETRIREDYLRILRFFRFHAWYGRSDIDADGLAASAALADGLDGLARERVGKEVRKLLAAPDPAPAVAAMEASGVLARILPGVAAGPLGVLVHLEAEAVIETEAGAPPDWLVRLALLGPRDAEGALRLSKAETRRLARLMALATSSTGPALMAESDGADLARAAMLVRCARSGAGLPDGLEAALARGAVARFPLTAADLLADGWRPGPALGTALAVARERWRSSDFSLDRDGLLREVSQKGQ